MNEEILEQLMNGHFANDSHVKNTLDPIVNLNSALGNTLPVETNTSNYAVDLSSLTNVISTDQAPMLSPEEFKQFTPDKQDKFIQAWEASIATAQAEFRTAIRNAAPTNFLGCMCKQLKCDMRNPKDRICGCQECHHDV